MSQFRPQVIVITAETVREANNSYPHRTVSYPTYRELKKNIAKHISENLELPLTVTRSRRGKWGEWFEKWQMVNGKPTIESEGWM